MTAHTHTPILPDGWVFESGRAGYIARRPADGAHTIPFEKKADAAQAAHNLEAAAADPKVAGMSKATATIAATNAQADPEPEIPRDRWKRLKDRDEAHIWHKIRGPQWQSHCGKVSQKEPTEVELGRRCTVCADAERRLLRPLPGGKVPEIPVELRLAGWKIENASREHTDGSMAEGWKIENPSLSIPWTVVYGRFSTAIELARKQQAEQIGYVRPPEMEERQTVRIDEIVASRWQPRRTFDEASLAELSESIREHGVLNPLQVIYNERCEIELVAGERRLRAAKQAGLDAVPVEVKEYTPRQCQEIAIIDNLQREGLSAIDEGRAYNRLIDELQLSENELAKRLGKNRAYIQQRRAIALAAPEVQQALEQGELTLSQARAVATVAPGDHKIQQAALKDIRRRATELHQTINEARAKEITESEVRKRAKKQLEALGWKLDDQIVWSDSQRPRVWTGAEMLEVAREGRKPGGLVPPTGTLTDAQRTILAVRYRISHGVEYKPWTRVTVDYDASTARYVTFAELIELVAEAEADFNAIRARYEAAGWELKPTSGAGNFQAVSRKGRTEWAYGWKGITETIEKIELGQIKDEQPPQLTREPSKQRCDRCKQMTETWKYHSEGTFCPTCYTAREVEAAAALAAIRERVVQLVGTSIDGMPDDLLRLVLSAIGINQPRILGEGYISPAERAQRYQAADTTTLQESFMDALAGHVDGWKHAPVLPQLVQPKAQEVAGDAT